MRLTSKGRYAVRAMLDLTFHSNGNPVRLQEISTRQSISLHYLEQLFRKLRTGQVVKSVRGPGGGYVLSRSMDEISVKDVLNCVGENINPAKDIIAPVANAAIPGAEPEVTKTVEFDLTKSYFENLGTIMQDYLSTTSLGDLFRRGKSTSVETSGESTEINNETAAPEATEASASTSPFESQIRSTIGEINQ
jgi:Rrf2 family iron-sulfur cluster assembly transcriptional regulator